LDLGAEKQNIKLLTLLSLEAAVAVDLQTHLTIDLAAEAAQEDIEILMLLNNQELVHQQRHL
tara:strand:- start:578 stop:763 length:186 start_codon:yes stop_codon:yes gene_type:complete